MSAHTEFDLGSLIWVKGEIDQALDKARQSLAKYATQADAAELKFAQTHLHQVRGAVEMVGLSGAARFAEELEVAVGSVERGEAEASLLAAVTDAAQSLTQYLEALINGAPDLALKLLPSYRRVREQRGERSSSGAELFFPPLSATLPPNLVVAKMDEAALGPYLKSARSRFEAGLLKWIKGERREGGQWMVQALFGVARSQTSNLQRGFWWAAAALAEGSVDNRAKLDIDLKQLFVRLNQQLKRLSDSGGKVAERLFRDVLYGVAHLETQSVQCAAVRQAFGLNALLPSGALEDDAQQLVSLQVARELKELVGQAKDNWARVGGGSFDRLPAFRQQLSEFAKRSGILAIVGFDDLVTAVMEVVGKMKAAPAEGQALEVATALLLLENSLIVFPERSTDFPAQAVAMQARLRDNTVGSPEVTLLDEVSRRAQERLLISQVAQEIQSNLGQIEQTLDDFFRDSSTRGELAGTDGAIRQIRGALTMLDERDAQLILDACANIVKSCQAEDYQAPAEELEFLAEAFSSLGFYIDALKREEAGRHRLIAPWLHKIRGDVMEEEPAASEPSQAEQIAAEFASGPEAEAELHPALHEANAPPAPASEVVSDAAVDAELLEVYLEEAVEVLDNVNSHLAVVRDQPTNKDALTVIRRGFHTLKGSGRMVGLNQLGEVAWAVEQVLNKWLQDEKRANPALLQLIEQASQHFSTWVEELKQSGAALVEASSLFAQAESLKSGGETEVSAAEAPAAAVEMAPPAMVDEAATLPVFDLSEADATLEIGAAPAPAEAEPALVDFSFDLEATAPDLAEPELAATEHIDLELPTLEVAEGLDFDLGLELDAAAADVALEPGSLELARTEQEADTAELVIGDIVISKALFGIFLDEAYHHFATLNDAFIDFSARGEVRPEFVHAAHTLCGIANTTGFTALGELGYAIEQALLAYEKVGGEPEQADYDILSHAIDKIGVMLGQIGRYETPSDEPQTIGRLMALVDRLKDTPLPGSVLDLPPVEVAAPAVAAPVELPAPVEAVSLESADEAVLDLDDIGLDFDLGDETIEPALVVAASETPTALTAESDLEIGLELPEQAEDHFDLDLSLPDTPALDLAEEGSEDALTLSLPEASQPVAQEMRRSEEELEQELDIELSLPDAIGSGEGTAQAVEAPVEFDGLDLSLDEDDLALDLSSASDGVTVEAEAPSFVLEEADHGLDLSLDTEPEPFPEAQPVEIVAVETAAEAIELPEAEPEWLPEPEVAAEPVSVPEPELELPVSLSFDEEAPAGDFEPVLLEAEAIEPFDLPLTDAALNDMPLAHIDETIVMEVGERPADDTGLDVAAVETGDLPQYEEVAALPIEAPSPAEADGVGSVIHLTSPDRLAEITVHDEIDEQLLPIFLEEMQELLPQLSADLRALRGEPGKSETHDSLKRVLHTLKGSARMAGAMRMGEATHNMETRLLNAGEHLPLALIDELDLDLDAITELQDHLVNGDPNAEAEADIAEMVAESLAETGGSQAGQAKPGRVVAAQPLGLVDPDAGKSSLRVRSDLVDRLVNQAGEVSISRTRIESEMLALKRSLLDLTDNVGRLRGQLREIEIQAESQMQSRMAHATDLPDFDPLEFDRFSRLQELTRFMAESVNDVATVQHNLLKNLDESSAALTQQARMTRDLQQELMRVRMVPFSSVSERLYRLVRQTGKETSKKVNLEIRGGRSEIDRGVLEKMVSPFEHMLRNAIDHGLEKPEQRLSSGKNEFGEIVVEARQEGNELVLVLRDDGIGLDIDRIRQKGLEKGMIEAGGEYTDAQIMALIFEVGFSTASSVTQLSGRGIGMDVVKTEIEDLGGRVEVTSERGQGTTFTIHLPLTLAVTQAVLVKVADKLFAIPSVMVEQVQEVKIEPLNELYQRHQAEWQGNVYPFHYLPRLLGDYDSQPEQKRYNTVMLLRSGVHRIAVHVDTLVKNQEVVVKNIGPQLVRVAGIAGATVLGNGEIVLIINPLALLQRRADAPVADFDAAMAASAPAPEEIMQVSPIVMVVDDSLTVRKITGRLLAREGYQVETAKDGVDALQKLQDIRPAVMLLDVEMPRMDGFELTRNMRANAGLRDIPIIMITSRTADKHKNYAFELGVNAFLGKPYQEDELLEHIRRLIGEEVAAG
ncbi:response regulator [Chitinimonas arctica]|uniref:Chemotaxis protein CheA n=1 Tax=Chitinimonas arctica TaxID=2594795 RepID=A0A516SES1_9NEIS|nr:Hpt domain-containing protein [Chitinimonas arctica]QDQ26652.1 response regulator [Chitinimonas arctica]